MIAHLQGTVINVSERRLIVSCNGVGYAVKVGNEVVSTVQLDQKVVLFIHTQVKEDDISLYGFLDEAPLQLFQQLLSVSGIGAKTAMAILDTPLAMLHQAIQQEDVSFLSKVPGLGKKTASRLILELQGKLEIHLPTQQEGNNIPRSLQEEALEALLSLGYHKPSVIRFLNSSEASYDSAEELVTAFLKNS